MYQVAYILKLSLRQLTGFFEDYAKTHHISAEIPNYSTLSRRLKSLNIKIIDKYNKEALNLAIDSTTLNLYCNSGAHNKEFGKERNYFRWEQTRKMHVALDIDSKFAKSILYTYGTTPDHQAIKALINKISNKENITSIRADRAYDRKPCYEVCHELKIMPIIPPVTNSIIKMNKIFDIRNKAILFIKSDEYGGVNYKQGLSEWKKETNYGKRSYIEAFFCRFKAIFGFSFKSKTEVNRRNELAIKCNILNRFTKIGMPIFELCK